jgi:hypothetical protein
MARPSAAAELASCFIASLGEEGDVSECADGTMAYEDTGVCTPDPLPDAAASVLIPRGDIIPVRTLGGERDLFFTKLDEVACVTCSRLRPTVSDPEEREEAMPLAIGEGSFPSSATIAALLAAPPLLEVSPNRAVGHCHQSTFLRPAGCER